MPLTQAQITALISSTVIDNTAKLITPETMRNVLNALNEKLELDTVWVASMNEQVIPTTGILNNIVTTSNVVRFTGAGAVLTGIVVPADRSKSMVLINDSGSDINIQHQSTSSLAGRRFFIPGGLSAGDNLPLSTGAAVRIEISNGSWRITDWFGDGYHPNLRGTTTRVIEVLANGKEQATESFDFEIFRPDLTTAQTDAALNTAYPTAFRGTQIVAKNTVVSGNPSPVIYKKDDDVSNTWIRIPILISVP